MVVPWSEHVFGDGRDGELQLVDFVVDEHPQRRHRLEHHPQREVVHVVDALSRRHGPRGISQHVVQLLSVISKLN